MATPRTCPRCRFIVCAVFVFGKWRLQSNPSAQSVAVTLLAKDVPMRSISAVKSKPWNCWVSTLTRSVALLRPERRSLFFRKKSGASVRLRYQKWMLFSLRPRLLHARRLSSAWFEERRPAPSILPAFIRPTENSRRTTTNIICSLASNRKNQATNE